MPDPSNPRRFRFGLRTLFVVMTVVAVLPVGFNWYKNAGIKWHCLNPRISGSLDHDDVLKIIATVRTDRRFARVSFRSVDGFAVGKARVQVVEHEAPHHFVGIELQCENQEWVITSASNKQRWELVLAMSAIGLVVLWSIHRNTVTPQRAELEL